MKLLVGEIEVDLVGLAFQDRHARFQVRRFQIRDQTPLEARAQAVFEGGKLFGRPVGGDDDLFAELVEVVENMEELFLSRLGAREKLDVVDHEDVGFAEDLADGADVAVADGVDHEAHEFFRRDQDHPRVGIAREDEVADRLHEVGLAQADASVNKKRVVNLAGILRHGLRGCVREPVVGAHDEG